MDRSPTSSPSNSPRSHVFNSPPTSPFNSPPSSPKQQKSSEKFLEKFVQDVTHAVESKLIAFFQAARSDSYSALGQPLSEDQEENFNMLQAEYLSDLNQRVSEQLAGQQNIIKSRLEGASSDNTSDIQQLQEENASQIADKFIDTIIQQVNPSLSLTGHKRALSPTPTSSSSSSSSSSAFSTKGIHSYSTTDASSASQKKQKPLPSVQNVSDTEENATEDFLNTLVTAVGSGLPEKVLTDYIPQFGLSPIKAKVRQKMLSKGYNFDNTKAAGKKAMPDYNVQSTTAQNIIQAVINECSETVGHRPPQTGFGPSTQGKKVQSRLPFGYDPNDNNAPAPSIPPKKRVTKKSSQKAPAPITTTSSSSSQAQASQPTPPPITTASGPSTQDKLAAFKFGYKKNDDALNTPISTTLPKKPAADPWREITSLYEEARKQALESPLLAPILKSAKQNNQTDALHQMIESELRHHMQKS